MDDRKQFANTIKRKLIKAKDFRNVRILSLEDRNDYIVITFDYKTHKNLILEVDPLLINDWGEKVTGVHLRTEEQKKKGLGLIYTYYASEPFKVTDIKEMIKQL